MGVRNKCLMLETQWRDCTVLNGEDNEGVESLPFHEYWSHNWCYIYKILPGRLL